MLHQPRQVTQEGRVFFSTRGATTTRGANTLSGLSHLQGAPSCGNGVHTQARNLSEDAITPVTQTLRFETHIESALVLIECADQKIDVGV
jgi:hypothetical protein